MESNRRGALIAVVLLAAATATAAENRKQFQFAVASGATISVVNEYGPITLRPAVGGQVMVTAITRSPQVEVDERHTRSRVEFRTHILQPVKQDEGLVDYEVQVPQRANVVLRSATGPIRVSGIEGDVTIEGDTAVVEVRDVGNGHVHVRTVNGGVKLVNVVNGHVEVSTVAGDVTLEQVTGSYLSVNDNSGKIRYTGDFASNGEYSFTNHAGDIEVYLPANASVDLSARSVSGSVDNDFPPQPKQHSAVPSEQGKSFAGTANAGSSSVRLRTFSGKIKIKKQ